MFKKIRDVITSLLPGSPALIPTREIWMKPAPDHLHADRHTLVGHAFFMLFSMLALMAMFTLCRTGLYWYNADLASSISRGEVLTSFGDRLAL